MSTLVITPRNPLRTFQFRVTVSSVLVAGCRSVSGLNMTVTPFEVWEGGNNLHRYANPNKVTWDPITLENGLALDNTLEKWAQAVVDWARTGLPPTSGQAVKRELQIDVWDLSQGTEPNLTAPASGTTDISPARSRSYAVHNAWISKYHALPKLDAMASEVAIQSVEIMHEGWELKTELPA